MQRYEPIWNVVARIPAGRVASYGQVAALAGYPRGARLVGRALSRAPDSLGLPWHRVVNAAGRISLPAGSPGFAEQVHRLRAEGVVVRGDRVSIDAAGWAPSLDELVWAPALMGDDSPSRPGDGKP